MVVLEYANSKLYKIENFEELRKFRDECHLKNAVACSKYYYDNYTKDGNPLYVLTTVDGYTDEPIPEATYLMNKDSNGELQVYDTEDNDATKNYDSGDLSEFDIENEVLGEEKARSDFSERYEGDDWTDDEFSDVFEDSQD